MENTRDDEYYISVKELMKDGEKIPVILVECEE